VRSKHRDRVRIRTSARPFFFIPESNAGTWFATLNWNYGASTMAMSWRELRKLVLSRQGEFVIARRLAPSELHVLAEYQELAHELYARLFAKDSMKWRSPRKR
jgi:hypothetical protein